jgi:hypothetical protein
MSFSFPNNQKKMKNSFLPIIIILSGFAANAQDFRGGEIHLVRVGILLINVTVDLYFNTSEQPGLDKITLAYGDNTVDTVQVEEILELDNDISLYRYSSLHTFPSETGYFITVMETFPLKDLLNVNPGIDFILQTFWNNSGWAGHLFNPNLANFDNLQTDYTIENGVFYFQLEGSDPDWYVAYSESLLLNHYITEYSVPEATNSIHLNPFTGEFIWERPVQAGKYLLGFDLLELLPASVPLIIDRRERFMIVEITEEDLLTGNERQLVRDERAISLYPNPANDLLTVQFDPLSREGLLRLFDYSGKLIMEEIVHRGSATVELFIGTLPNGVYCVNFLGSGVLFIKN